MAHDHDAFVSYSHAADGALAPVLEAAMERLARPTFKLRAMDVFRDQTSLAANPGLWSGIVEHLSGSRWLVLLACPASAHSVWCGKEVLWWLDNRGASTVLVALTEGEIVWDEGHGDFDWTRTSALSRDLERRFSEEPLFVDLRWARTESKPERDDPRVRGAALDLAATIRGLPKEQLDGEDVRQLRRNRRLASLGVAAIALAAVMATWQAVVATRQRRVAEHERDRALSRQLAAQANEVRVREPVLALLLAARAWQVQDTPEAATALLRVNNGLPLERIIEHPARLSAMTVTPGAGSVVGGDAAGAVMRWNLAGRSQEILISAPPARLLNGVQAVAASADGQHIAAAGYGGVISLWQAGAPLRKLEPPEAREMIVLALAFSPDGQYLASGSSTSVTWLFDVASGNARSLGGSNGDVSQLAFSPDGNWLGIGADNSPVRVVALKGGASFELVGRAGGAVVGLRFSADGREIFAAHINGAIEIFDAADRKLKARFDARDHDLLRAFAVAPDGQAVLTGHGDGAVIHWPRAAWGSEGAGREITRHGAPVNGVEFTNDGARFVSAAADGRMFISQPLDQPALFRPLAGSAPTGTASAPQILRLSHAWQGLPKEMDGNYFAASSDGKLLAVAVGAPFQLSGPAQSGSGPRVAVFNTQSLQRPSVSVESFHKDYEIFAGPLWFSPDGKLLVSSTAGYLTWVDAATLQRLDEAVRMPEGMQLLGFARGDHQLVATVPRRREPLALDARTEAWAAQACALAARGLTAAEWARYVSRETAHVPVCLGR